MIVSSGYNIGAPQVENALCGQPAVHECAATGKIQRFALREYRP